MIDPFDDEVPSALGLVVDRGRGSLPFALIHGEALVTCASWALSEAGVLPLDARTTAAGLRDADEIVVLHDSLCPMTPHDFISECIRRSDVSGRPVVAYRPVTDTLKVLDESRVGDSVDRDQMVALASPIVIPPAFLGLIDPESDLSGIDFGQLLTALRAGAEVELVEAPASARRVCDVADVEVLAALTRPAGGWPTPDPQET